MPIQPFSPSVLFQKKGIKKTYRSTGRPFKKSVLEAGGIRFFQYRLYEKYNWALCDQRRDQQYRL
jgi:hypothetical protein